MNRDFAKKISCDNLDKEKICGYLTQNQMKQEETMPSQEKFILEDSMVPIVSRIATGVISYDISTTWPMGFIEAYYFSIPMPKGYQEIVLKRYKEIDELLKQIIMPKDSSEELLLKKSTLVSWRTRCDERRRERKDDWKKEGLIEPPQIKKWVLNSKEGLTMISCGEDRNLDPDSSEPFDYDKNRVLLHTTLDSRVLPLELKKYKDFFEPGSYFIPYNLKQSYYGPRKALAIKFALINYFNKINKMIFEKK